MSGPGDGCRPAVSAKLPERHHSATTAIQALTSAIATIQSRNVPDSVHRIYQARAAMEGKSLQEYMLAELIRAAGVRTPREVVIEIERDLHAGHAEGFADVSSASVLAEDRESH